MNTSNLSWNVFKLNSNLNALEMFDIFSHNEFYNECENVIKTLLHNNINMEININEFSEEIDKILKYYFKNRLEYECNIVGNPPETLHLNKMDVYYQIKLNWDIFISYLLNNVTYFLDKHY